MAVSYGRAGSFRTRLRNAVAFVAIVWAIAASFIAFEVVALAATSLALAYPQVFGRLVLSSDTIHSTACTVGPGERSRETHSPEAAVAAWALGLSLGRDAMVRQLTSVSPDLLAASASAIGQLAGGLGVRPPPVFAPRRIANAHREFVSFIETDASQTAHQLAAKYSPRACQLYKLGSVWGYSTMLRPVLPGEAAVFAVEINYYARQVGLPESLWEPMIERTPRDADRDRLVAETNTLTDGVTSRLMRQP